MNGATRRHERQPTSPTSDHKLFSYAALFGGPSPACAACDRDWGRSVVRARLFWAVLTAICDGKELSRCPRSGSRARPMIFHHVKLRGGLATLGLSLLGDRRQGIGDIVRNCQRPLVDRVSSPGLGLALPHDGREDRRHWASYCNHSSDGELPMRWEIILGILVAQADSHAFIREAHRATGYLRTHPTQYPCVDTQIWRLLSLLPYAFDLSITHACRQRQQRPITSDPWNLGKTWSTHARW